MDSPIRVALDQPQPGLGEGRIHALGQDRAVVIEAVETGGQAPDPGGDLGRRPVEGGAGHHFGKLLEAADELELALVGEKGEVDGGERRPGHPELVSLAAHPTDAGTGHLDVEDRVLHRLLPHHRQVEGAGLVERCHQAQDAGGVGADVGDQRVERDGVAGPLPHLHGGVPIHQRHHLSELDLEPSRVDAERLDPSHQTGHLPVMVGAEHVDHPVEATDEELVTVVGEVPGQVGGITVGLAQDTIAAVTQFGGTEPGGSVQLEHQAPFGQKGDGLVDGTALLDGGLAVPLVEDDPHRLEGGPNALEDPVRRPSSGHRHVVGPVVVSGQLGDVLALVPAFGHLLPAMTGEQALPERPDLPTGVVDVVLAAHLIAGAGQHPGQGVAVTPPPAVSHMDGPGRVGRDELHLDPLAVPDVGSGVAVLTRLEDARPGHRAAIHRRAGS